MNQSIIVRCLLGLLLLITGVTVSQLTKAQGIHITLTNDIDANNTSFIATGVRAQHWHDSKGHYNRQTQGSFRKYYFLGARALHVGIVFSEAPKNFHDHCAFMTYCGLGHTQTFDKGKFMCLSSNIEIKHSTEFVFHLNQAGELTCEKNTQLGPEW